VYVEEVSFRSKSIEGVSTSTAGYVGAARSGPFNGTPELVTSFAEFERVFGSLDQLTFTGEDASTTTSPGVAFFDNGGQRVCVSRIYNRRSTIRPTPPRQAPTIWISRDTRVLDDQRPAGDVFPVALSRHRRGLP
jgi:hypothetical protein